MGLAGLWAIDGKYGRRQLAVERQGQGRERAVELRETGQATTEVSDDGALAVSLRPLYLVLAALMALAWAALWRGRIARPPARSHLADDAARPTTPVPLE